MANLKNIKKGDKVILRMFTGAFIEAKVVEMADAKKIGFTSKAGVKMVFDKATGKQISPEPKNPKYANFVEEYDEEAEAEGLAKKNAPRKPKAEAKKAVKKPVEPEVEEELEDEEEDEESDEDEEEEEISYEDMSLAELREECKERGIKFTSKMKEGKLIELLEEYDEQEDEEYEDDDEEDFEDEGEEEE